MAINDRTVPVEGFPRGVNNVARETPVGALKAAVNVDLSDDGKPRRRAGYTLVREGENVQSLFGHEQLPYGVVRTGDALVALEGDDLAPTVLVENLGTGPASYAVLNHELLWTVEGVACGVIDGMMEPRPMGVPTPPAPSCRVAAGGGLPAGRYGVALSYMLASGEDGGLSPMAMIEVADNGAIVVDLPEPPLEVEAVRVWRTQPNGTVLAHATDVVAGMLEATLRDGALGRDAETMGLHPLPAGHLVRVLNGIAWMAVENQIYHGIAMRPFLHRPGFDRIPYRDRIDMMEPVGEGDGAGMFVSAGKRVFWVSGGRTGNLTQRIAHAHGAVPGTSLLVPGDVLGMAPALVAYWVSSNGVACVGLPGGEVLPMTKDSVAMDRFTRGASLLREVDGLRSIVTAGRGAIANAFGAGDSVELVHYRNGIAVP